MKGVCGGGEGGRRGFYVCEWVGNVKLNGHREAVKKRIYFCGVFVGGFNCEGGKMVRTYRTLQSSQ